MHPVIVDKNSSVENQRRERQVAVLQQISRAKRLRNRPHLFGYLRKLLAANEERPAREERSVLHVAEEGGQS